MKRCWGGVLFLVMLAMCFFGCSGKEEHGQLSESKETWKKYKDIPVTLEWYINYSWYTTPWGQNVVSKAITAETGVTIKFVTPKGNEMQKLKSMIASDTLPDLITLGWWEKDIQTMITEGMVYPLNQLADQYDTYFYNVANGEVIRWYTEEDGNLYCYPNSASTYLDFVNGRSIGSNQNFLVRKDIYEAIGSPDMTTPEGFLEAIVKAVELYPTVEGYPLIPIGSDAFNATGCNSFDKYLFSFLAIPYEKDGKYNDRYLDEEYIRWLKAFREMNELGYLSNEIFIDTRAQLEEKMAEGRYFCLLYQGSDIQTPQKILYDKNPDSIYIAVDGPKNSKGGDPVLPNIGINGWTVTLVSKNCKEPERAIAFLSYLLSDEGQKMTYLGVEGSMYEEVNGSYIRNPEVEELLEKNRTEYDKIYGADNAYWMLQDNVRQEKWFVDTDDIMASLKEWTIPYTEYTCQYDILLQQDTPLANLKNKIDEEWGKTLPLLLLADSEEEFDRELEAYRKKKYDLGFDRLLEEYTKRMEESKKKLGILQ